MVYLILVLIPLTTYDTFENVNHLDLFEIIY